MTQKELLTRFANSREDVLQRKNRTHCDESRRKSKRQKALADIFRLSEAHPRFQNDLLEELLRVVD